MRKIAYDVNVSSGSESILSFRLPQTFPSSRWIVDDESFTSLAMQFRFHRASSREHRSINVVDDARAFRLVPISRCVKTESKMEFSKKALEIGRGKKKKYARRAPGPCYKSRKTLTGAKVVPLFALLKDTRLPRDLFPSRGHCIIERALSSWKSFSWNPTRTYTYIASNLSVNVIQHNNIAWSIKRLMRHCSNWSRIGTLSSSFELAFRWAAFTHYTEFAEIYFNPDFNDLYLSYEGRKERKSSSKPAHDLFSSHFSISYGGGSF